MVGRVGKTSLVVRYCKNEFNDQQQSTIQASHLQQRVQLGECAVTLNVWVCGPNVCSIIYHCPPPFAKSAPADLAPTLRQDTAGQERFHALGPIYYRDADGACARRVLAAMCMCALTATWCLLAARSGTPGL